MQEHPPSAAGRAPGRGLIERVREGMTVLDASGEKIGKVEYVQMGDPDAVTTAGNEPPEPSIVGQVARAVLGDEREPDVQEPLRSQLLRTGFLKVDGSGFFGDDRYVRADLIQAVDDDSVTVAAPKDRLPRES